jgi:hypothetical protein
MKKSMIVFAFMAMVLLTNCSTTEEGVSVARVYNTECSHALRGAALTDSEDGDAGEMPQMEVKLTREGDIISGEIVNYPIGCSHGELYVDCQQTGKRLDVRVREKTDGDGIRTNCICWVNVYFTLFDVEGDTFLLTLDGQDMGEVSLK